MAEQDDSQAACSHKVPATGSCWGFRDVHGPGIGGALKFANVDSQLEFALIRPMIGLKGPPRPQVVSCKPLKTISANQGKN